jgi:hypothetical protein
MRSLAYQFGLSLAILFAWPLLGGGSQAHASFLVPSPIPSSESGMNGCDTAAPDSERNQEADKQPGRDIPVRVNGVDPLLAGAQTGAGAAGASGSSTVGGSVLQAAAVFSHVNLAPLPVVRWLYFEDVHFRPPPFSSRLFRPPRVG